jgi:transcriptional regulator with XRE-family HTH domain
MISAPTQSASVSPSRRMPGHVARIRFGKGLSQVALAEAAGVGRSTVIRVESGTCAPTLRTMKAIASALTEPVGAVFPRLLEHR